MKKSFVIISLSALLFFAVSAMAQTKVVVIPIGGKKPAGDAAAMYVLEGQTFSNKDGVNIPGTMVNNGALTFDPGTGDQSIPEGYHNGSGTVKGDANLTTGNIRSGVSIFGQGGTYTGIGGNVQDTSTGDALVGEILSPKKAWVDGVEVNGTMPTQTLTAASTTSSAGYYDAIDLATVDTDLLAHNIACGTTIFGIEGTHTNIPNTVCSAGLVWMDRNLGATQVATSSTDSAAYGDLYQWGRLSDGHENRTSLTNPAQSSTDAPGHGSFIIGSIYDWLSSPNPALWQPASGINNPCPAGFRVPTETEWNDERLSWSSNNAAGAFASPLALVLAGYRYYLDGTLLNVGSVGNYWSSTVDGSNNSRALYFGSGDASMYSNYRAFGMSVRCIKD